MLDIVLGVLAVAPLWPQSVDVTEMICPRSQELYGIEDYLPEDVTVERGTDVSSNWYVRIEKDGSLFDRVLMIRGLSGIAPCKAKVYHSLLL